jgi:hypothetical protein
MQCQAAGLAQRVRGGDTALHARRITSVRDAMFRRRRIVLAIVLRNASCDGGAPRRAGRAVLSGLYAAGITVVAAREPFDLSLDAGLAWTR